MANTLFIPTEVPWQDLKGKDLEELLYWLFDSMGAKELEWRIGGSGSGTSDQGRDLELSFYVSTPDGDLVKQRWWVETKGRAGTVEPFEVKSAVINAAGKTDIDVVVIATNTNFSNPTRDWVKEWQSTHARPRIKLWERTELESYCSKSPIAVIRLFAKALTSQGKLEVAKAKLWDYATFTDEPTLIKLWNDREELDIDARALLAIVASEMANGDIEARSWAMHVDSDLVTETLGDGLINFLYLVFRANENGVRQTPVIRSLAYLTLVCAHRIGVDSASALLAKVWESVEGREYPEELRKLILQPVLSTLNDEVRDVCISDCSRVHTDRITLRENEVETYWRRLSLLQENPKQDDRILTIELCETPCKVGFQLDKEHSCPLCHNDEPETNIAETLRVIRVVSDVRRNDHDA